MIEPNPKPMRHRPKPVHGPRRLVRACRQSVAGLRHAWREEAAFREEALLACVMLPAAWWLGRTAVEVALLSAVVVLVLMAELLNTGLEAVVDLVSPSPHPLAGMAKDCGSAAVLLADLLAGGVWGWALLRAAGMLPS